MPHTVFFLTVSLKKNKTLRDHTAESYVQITSVIKVME